MAISKDKNDSEIVNLWVSFSCNNPQTPAIIRDEESEQKFYLNEIRAHILDS